MEVMWSSGGDREVEGGKYRGCSFGLKLPGTLARVGSNSLRGAPKLEGHLGEGLGRPDYKPILCGAAVRLRAPSRSRLLSPGNLNLLRDGRKETLGGAEQ